VISSKETQLASREGFARKTADDSAWKNQLAKQKSGANAAPLRLLSKAKPFNDGLVSFLIIILQIIEETTTTGNKHQKATSTGMVLFVVLQVLGQIGNPVAEHSNLDLRRASVRLSPLELSDQFCFLFLSDRHRNRLPCCKCEYLRVFHRCSS